MYKRGDASAAARRRPACRNHDRATTTSSAASPTCGSPSPARARNYQINVSGPAGSRPRLRASTRGGRSAARDGPGASETATVSLPAGESLLVIERLQRFVGQHMLHRHHQLRRLATMTHHLALQPPLPLAGCRPCALALRRPVSHRRLEPAGAPAKADDRRRRSPTAPASRSATASKATPAAGRADPQSCSCSSGVDRRGAGLGPLRGRRRAASWTPAPAPRALPAGRADRR